MQETEDEVRDISRRPQVPPLSEAQGQLCHQTHLHSPSRRGRPQGREAMDLRASHYAMSLQCESWPSNLLGSREKVDAMREEIKQMRSSLEAVLIQGLRRTEVEGDPSEILPESRCFSPRPDSPPEELVSPARHVSARETSRREEPRSSSPGHPTFDEEQQHGPEGLKEPMGSLFEVTKLRSNRNNETATQTSQSRRRKGTCQDLITRGVVPEVRAQELYNM